MTLANYQKNSERGQALIVIAFALVVLAGVIALVIDGGNVFLDRRNAQNAADSAALAGALARIRGGQNPMSVALTSAANNGYTNDGSTSVVTVEIPPASGPHAGDVEYIQVIIVSHVKTYVASILGWSQLTNEVQAVARSKASELKQLLNGPALVSLAPNSNCGSGKSFWIHGEVSLQITGGGVFVNSNNRDCALVQEGSGKVHLENAYQINVVGGASIQKAQFLTPSVIVGQVPISFPPPFLLPEVDCGEEEATVKNGTSMSPGKWGDEDFPPEGVTNLEAGVYCLDGDFIVGEGRTLTGTDVVIKVNKGEINFSREANISLDAPSSGELFGLLLFMPIENNSPVVLDGSKGSILTGTILTPGAPITIIGSSPKHEYHSQIIGYTIQMEGQHQVDIIYKNSENFDSMSMPEVQLSE